MMDAKKVILEFAELHTPLFLGGKNHGLKLSTKDGLGLVLDRNEKELIVTFMHSKEGVCEGFVPLSNVVCMWPMRANKTKEKEKPAVVVEPKGKIQAQVEGPQSHVFAGPGGGKR